MTEETESSEAKGMSLSELLAHKRKIRKLSLREVEEATNREVSNAYLSQLENGHIKKPSPNILYALARLYALPYSMLMEKAGYIVQSDERSDAEKHGRVATFAEENLTKEEEEELLRYLSFIRTKKGDKR